VVISNIMLNGMVHGPHTVCSCAVISESVHLIVAGDFIFVMTCSTIEQAYSDPTSCG